MLILVSGGSASGKSEFAESLVLQSGCDRRYYLATMIPYDEECRRRIARHRKMRAAKGFETIEVPVRLRGISFPSTLKEGRCALLECMSNLAANEIFSSDGEMRDGGQVVREILEGIDRLQALCEQVIVVTNELFSDGARYDPGTEQYLRALGEINRRIAQRADRVYEVVAGIPILWKGVER